MARGKEIVTRCGMRCDLCPAYKDNISTADLEGASKAWKTYFGLDFDPASIRCDGCLEESGHLLDSTCPVRPCVTSRGLEDCSQCSNMPCDKLKQRLVDLRSIEERIGGKVPRGDYLRFIRPFENVPRLEAMGKRNRSIAYRMWNPLLEPDEGGMRRFVGTAVADWDAILEHAGNQPGLSRDIAYFGKGYGWTLRLRRRGRPYFWLFPEVNNFTTLMVLGREEQERVKGIQSSLSPGISKAIETANRYHDGAWCWLHRTSEGAYESDIIQLLSIKEPTGKKG
jgi:hypothetical protein